MTTAPPPIPQAFIWRRLHSITGVFIVLFLISHLLTNSQAALFVGEDGSGFVDAVNSIHNLPYLPFIEIALLAVPILIHMVWGIRYLQTGELNSFRSDGTTPSLPEYSRNRAYSWQRITSWVLLFGILAHVIQMRILEYPVSTKVDNETHYMLPVSLDAGLITLAQRLNVRLLTQKMIDFEKTAEPASPEWWSLPSAKEQLVEQRRHQQEAWAKALDARALKEGEVLAVAPDFGTIELLLVRDTFKSPLMIALYTLFVLAACFHGFNGLWTSMITWGVTISEKAQKNMLFVSTALMVAVTFLGLAAIWGTFWLNLKQ